MATSSVVESRLKYLFLSGIELKTNKLDMVTIHSLCHMSVRKKEISTIFQPTDANTQASSDKSSFGE